MDFVTSQKDWKRSDDVKSLDLNYFKQQFKLMMKPCIAMQEKLEVMLKYWAERQRQSESKVKLVDKKSSKSKKKKKPKSHNSGDGDDDFLDKMIEENKQLIKEKERLE